MLASLVQVGKWSVEDLLKGHQIQWIFCSSFQKATGSGGAFGALKSLAFSLLDQWLFSAKKEGLKAAATGPGPGTGVAEENRSNNETLEVHPMRYLFLLGLLPTTFGSLYSLG